MANRAEKRIISRREIDRQVEMAKIRQVEGRRVRVGDKVFIVPEEEKR